MRDWKRGKGRGRKARGRGLKEEQGRGGAEGRAAVKTQGAINASEQSKCLRRLRNF